MISRIAFFVAATLMCYTSFFFYPRWQHKDTEATISWDVSGYYWYLPSVFIYHDLKHQSFKDSILNKYRPTNTEFQQGLKCENGNYVMKYSSGMALMFLPFFTVAHLLAGALGYPRDGFSVPYQFAIQLAGLFFSLLGLWYLRKLLLNFYKDKVVGIILLLLVFGSNYLNYAAVDCGMSHCWLFTIYVFLMLNTHYYYQTFKIKYAVWIGLLVGLCTLIRPTDVIACVIPIFWGLESLTNAAIDSHFSIWKKNYKALIIAVVCAAAVVSIQLIYWKYVTGHWLFYSYGNEQGFSFFNPHPILYTFSYRTGWLRYTPMFLLSFAGIIPFLYKGKNKVAILSFFIINYYIVCAWDIWWFGGRAMVQSYPILLFPMAALVEAALNKKIWKWLFVAVAALFLYMNVWITWMYHKGNLYDPDGMSANYYWRVAGRWTAPDSIMLLKEGAELFEGNAKSVKLVYVNNFINDTSSMFVTDVLSGNKFISLNKERQNSPNFSFPLTEKSAEWLRIQATFKCKNKEWSIWNMCQFVVRIIDKNRPENNRIIKESVIRPYRIVNEGETKDVAFEIKLPVVHFDHVEIIIWNADSGQETQIGNLKAWTFNE